MDVSAHQYEWAHSIVTTIGLDVVPAMAWSFLNMKEVMILRRPVVARVDLILNQFCVSRSPVPDKAIAGL